jgi:hypothetical protein
MKGLGKLKQYAVSSDDILKAFNNNVKIVSYPELNNYSSIDELFGNFDACFILYMTGFNSGHWCLLFRRDNYVEFFDPYGFIVDSQLNYANPEYNGQKFPYLTKLLYTSPYKIHYNNHKLQRSKKEVATCGRHCIFRYQNKNLSIDKYAKILKEYKKYDLDADDIVTLMTSNIK